MKSKAYFSPTTLSVSILWGELKAGIIHTVEAAEGLGFGSREYELITC